MKVALNLELPILHKESHEYWQKRRYGGNAANTVNGLSNYADWF